MCISDRVRFKRGILSIMYGARENTSKNMLRCSFDDLRKIKEYFMIEEFKKSLEDQFEEESAIFNYYGRPVCFDHSLINYWIQSSAVDFCSLAFGKFIDDFKVNPCFYVHDCLVFEIQNDRICEFKDVKSLIDPHSNISIPVEFNILGR